MYVVFVVKLRISTPPLFIRIERIGIVNVPPLIYLPLPPFSKRITRQCRYISPLSCLFRKLEGTNNGSLMTGIVLYQRSWHDCQSRCHPVGVAAIVRQMGGPNLFVNVMSPHNTAYRPAALHGHHSHHPIYRSTTAHALSRTLSTINFRMGMCSPGRKLVTTVYPPPPSFLPYIL